ncbi:MAG: hypothetical protein AB2L20_18645 [Mangrovibacterium sp.]
MLLFAQCGMRWRKVNGIKQKHSKILTGPLIALPDQDSYRLDWMYAWFSDGDSDYIKHFIGGTAAVPEWAPAGENHLLGSTGIVQKINYNDREITYRTFLPASTEVLRLAELPKQLTIDGKLLNKVDEPATNEGWQWEKLKQGGILRVKHLNGKDLKIIK